MFVIVDTLSLSTEIISVGKKAHVPNACFSTLWRFELHEPKQLPIIFIAFIISIYLPAL